MKHFILTLFAILATLLLQAQESSAAYGLKIYELILANDIKLQDEFVDLNQYTAFIDRLEYMSEEEKESIKFDAAKTYTEIKRDYNAECLRILQLYKNGIHDGITFTFLNSQFSPSKNFEEIGMVSCFYIADIPNEEEPLEDAIRFECIKTINGWRILDGFFDDPVIN